MCEKKLVSVCLCVLMDVLKGTIIDMHAHKWVYIYIYAYICSPMGVELSGEGIVGHR